MNYLSVNNLSKYYGEKLLFEQLEFGINKGDRVAFVAQNGSGKSSLFKILAGLDVPDNGVVHLNKNIRIGYLAQEPDFDSNLTVSEFLEKENSEIISTIKDYEELLSQYSPEKQSALDELSARMDALQAWNYKRNLEVMLDRFAITDLRQSVATLSGGQKKRLSMAMLLVQEPDFLLLDEPTNHLDVEMIEWLEQYLSTKNTTLFLVTHDRYFLDAVCNKILELYGGKLYLHNGNYAYYLEKKAEREQIFDITFEKNKKRYKKELEWMRRSPQARTTKAKSRIDAFYKLEETVKQNRNTEQFDFTIKNKRQGGKILVLKNIRKAYGDKKLIENFSHTFSKGERIGIVGDNGSGKTTFLNILAGDEQPDGGKINRGDNLFIGYYTQVGLPLKEEKRVIDTVKGIAEYIELGDGRKLSASQFLQYFMFDANTQFTPISKLSGGERKRLQLIMVLIQNPNFLILDEPTNDLDLPTLNKLEEFLEAYPGCLIIVSHDRYFMDQLVDQLFAFEGNGKIKGYICTYSEYRERKSKVDIQDQPKQKEVKAVTVDQTISKKIKNEIKKLERQIEALEGEKNQLEQKIQTATSEEITEYSVRIGAVIEEIELLTERWMELV